MTSAVPNIPAPSGFRDGRTWLDQDPPTWCWPETKVILAGDIPVRLNFQGEPIGRVAKVGRDEQGLLFEMEVDAGVLERITGLPPQGFSIA